MSRRWREALPPTTCVTNRKGVVVVFTYALRAALDELSPDERAAWLQLALAEIQR